MQDEEIALKKIAWATVKIGVSAALLSYLFYQAAQNDAFQNLWSQPKDWLLLGLGWAVLFAVVLLTIVRWHLLLRVIALPVTWRQSLRISFLGYLFNFFSLGTVGGDALRAFLVAQRCPGRRAEAAATVIVDRVLGLFALFLLAASTLFFIDWPALHAHKPDAAKIVERMCQASALFAVMGAAGLLACLAPQA